MDLVDRVEGSRFLGREFLVWLWCSSDLLQDGLRAEGIGAIRLWLEDQLTLEGGTGEPEKHQLSAPAPGHTREAREALRQGKLPSKARVVIEREERTFRFNLDADSLALSAVKLPALMREETDEQFHERMYLLDELEAIMGALLEQFLRLRLAPGWAASLLPVMRAWVSESATPDHLQYRDLLDAVLKSASAPKPPSALPEQEIRL